MTSQALSEDLRSISAILMDIRNHKTEINQSQLDDMIHNINVSTQLAQDMERELGIFHEMLAKAQQERAKLEVKH